MYSGRNLVIAIGALLCVGCGGGGGGGGEGGGGLQEEGNPIGNTGGQGSTSGQGSVDSIDPVITSSCSMQLASTMSAQVTEEMIVIPDLGPGCDYLVSGTLQIQTPLTFEAGVTVVLEEGVSVFFRGDDVTLQGSPTNPVRFQADPSQGAWGMLQFSGVGTVLEHALISGGGQGIQDGAMVNLRGDSASVLDSTFAGSLSSGLEITSTDVRDIAMDGFARNTFVGNSAYPVIVDGEYATDLDAASDYLGTSEPNGEAAVLVGGRGLSRSRVRNIGAPIRISEFVFGIQGVSDVVIEPGVILEFPEFTDIALSDFSAEGTADSPIVFRGWPDSVSGWDGLRISGEVALSHVVTENAGSASGGLGAAIFVDFRFVTTFDDISISDLSVMGSEGFGLNCEELPASLEGRVELVNASFENIALTEIAPGCDIENVVDATTTVDSERRDIGACEVIPRNGVELPSTLINRDSDCDYYVIGSLVTEDLSIQAGTTIVFARNADMSIGTLSVFGSQAEPVEFVGEFIDPGSWDGLTISGNSVLQSARVVDGGDERGAGVSISDALTISVTDTDVTGSAGIGMELTSTYDSSNPSRGTVIETFSGNTFLGNSLVGLSIPVELVPSLDVQSEYDSPADPNGESGIRLSETHSVGSISLSPQFGVPWRFASYRAFRADSSSLLVEPGTEILVEPGGVMVLGSFAEMTGTVDAPIIISGAGADPTEWGGITVGSALSAQYVEVTGGGASGNGLDTVGGPGAPFLVLGTLSTLTLDNVTIEDSRSWGVSCVRTNAENVLLTNMTYARNALGDVQPSCFE